MTPPPMDLNVNLASTSTVGPTRFGSKTYGNINAPNQADPSMSIILGAAVIGLAIILARGL